MNDHAAASPDAVFATKASVAWGGAGLSGVLQWMGFSSWGEFAGFAASIYSLILIGEWVYKKWKASRGTAPTRRR
jgi:hypothetical protein